MPRYPAPRVSARRSLRADGDDVFTETVVRRGREWTRGTIRIAGDIATIDTNSAKRANRLVRHLLKAAPGSRLIRREERGLDEALAEHRAHAARGAARSGRPPRGARAPRQHGVGSPARRGDCAQRGHGPRPDPDLPRPAGDPYLTPAHQAWRLVDGCFRTGSPEQRFGSPPLDRAPGAAGQGPAAGQVPVGPEGPEGQAPGDAGCHKPAWWALASAPGSG